MKLKVATLEASKNLALVAHDNKKTELCDWVFDNREKLASHTLMATGTTGYKLQDHTGLEIASLMSGPLGGDQQIGAGISQGQVDILIFFWDPFEPMPHDPDVKALLRIAAVWNIPVACNPASADFIISSPLIAAAYTRNVPDYDAYLKERKRGSLQG